MDHALVPEILEHATIIYEQSWPISKKWSFRILWYAPECGGIRYLQKKPCPNCSNFEISVKHCIGIVEKNIYTNFHDNQTTF